MSRRFVGSAPRTVTRDFDAPDLGPHSGPYGRRLISTIPAATAPAAANSHGLSGSPKTATAMPTPPDRARRIEGRHPARRVPLQQRRLRPETEPAHENPLIQQGEDGFDGEERQIDRLPRQRRGEQQRGPDDIVPQDQRARRHAAGHPLRHDDLHPEQQPARGDDQVPEQVRRFVRVELGHGAAGPGRQQHRRHPARSAAEAGPAGGRQPVLGGDEVLDQRDPEDEGVDEQRRVRGVRQRHADVVQRDLHEQERPEDRARSPFLILREQPFAPEKAPAEHEQAGQPEPDGRPEQRRDRVAGHTDARRGPAPQRGQQHAQRRRPPGQRLGGRGRGPPVGHAAPRAAAINSAAAVSSAAMPSTMWPRS